MTRLWLLVAFLATTLCHLTLAQLKTEDLTAQTTTPAPKKSATYWITFSDKIRPGQPLELKVNIMKGADPVTVTFTILSSNRNKTLLAAPPTVVQPGGVRTITIIIPQNIKKPSEENQWENQYVVKVKGQGNTVNFHEERYVSYDDKSFSIIVQTDKSIYKPGQNVKIRVLAMTSDLKVLRNESKDVYITDAKGNKIRQWLDIKDQNGYGVNELTFQLADKIPLGDWTIEVIMRGITETKPFSVENYVLPKFEVEVTPPAIPLIYDPTLPVTVKAKYTFGKPVTKGRVDVLIQLAYNWYANRANIKLSGQLNGDGQYQFEVSNKQLTDMLRKTIEYDGVNLMWYPIEIIANVTELDTGRVQSSTASVQYYESLLKINFLDISPSSFKPGLTYTGYIEIKKKDDTTFDPTELSKIRVRVNVTYEVPLSEKELEEQRKQNAPEEDTAGDANSTSSNTTTLTQAKYIRPPYYWYPRTKTLVLELAQPLLTPTDQGWITVSFNVPPEASSVSIEAKCLEPFEKESTSKYVTKMLSPTNSFLQLKAPTVMPKIGDSVTIRAEATDVITKLNCQIYSKGQLVLADVTSAPAGSKSLNYTFTITQSMSLKINIVCFYIREENSEFVVDAVAIGVDGLFVKPVTIQFNETTVKPGQELKVTLKGEPDSIFFTGANDKSVLLLKSGHDITQERVREELMEYDGFGGGIGWRYIFMCGWPSYFSGNNAADVFNGANVIVISDGLISNDRPELPEMDMPPSMMVDKSASGPEGGVPGSSSGVIPATTVRRNFPETWLWDLHLVPADSNGQVEYTVTAPDTITSFVATAFSVHPTYGLSVVQEPAVVTIFRDLFISLPDTASSIIKGEDYCFKCTVFSYYKGELPVLLTLDKSDSFSNIHVKREGDQVILAKESLYYSYFLGYLEENDIVTSTYCVTLNVIGDVTIKMSALTNIPGLSDALEQNITVKPEGVPRTTSRSFLVDLSSGLWQQIVPISFPDSTVEGSQSIVVNCAGSMLGPQIKNFRDLLRMPYGCGEQNMLNFAPNIFLTKLMLVLNKTFSDILEQAKQFMLIGYQKEIMYEHPNTGGFSTFGCHQEPCGNASLWLTAFITKCFSQAKQLYKVYPDGVDVDNNILQRSIDFMLKQQNQNGSFTEYGRVFHKEMQGGSAEGEALTAYTVIALYEAVKAVGENYSSNATEAIQKADNFLRSRLPYLTDTYDICLVAYTLHLINSQGKDEIFNKMEKIAIIGDGLKYWKRPTKVQTDVYSWSASAESISIEATAYALLTYDLKGMGPTAGLPIVRWLSQNRGPNGGFISTQDTVIGLQALSTVVATLNLNEDIPMTLSVTYENSDGQTNEEKFHVNKANEMLLQSIYIDFKNKSPRNVSIKAVTDDGRKGPSAVVAEVVMYYNVKDETKAQVYGLDYELVTLSNSIELTVNIRSFIQEADTGMTILEVDLFPSYSPDTEVLTANKNISLVEILDDKLTVYFDAGTISPKGVTVKIPMTKTSGVLTKSLPRFLKVYSYYEPSKELTKTYSLEAQPNFCQAVGDYGVCGIGQA